MIRLAVWTDNTRGVTCFLAERQIISRLHDPGHRRVDRDWELLATFTDNFCATRARCALAKTKKYMYRAKQRHEEPRETNLLMLLLSKCVYWNCLGTWTQIEYALFNFIVNEMREFTFTVFKNRYDRAGAKLAQSASKATLHLYSINHFINCN